MVDWYKELADLIEAQGKPWFSSALQGALQPLFHYDYFLQVLFKKGEGVQVRRSDFRHQTMAIALRNYEAETHIGDPIYRLYEAEKLESGVYDMETLVQRCAGLPPVDTSKLRHIMRDSEEDMGFRTIGWPEHLQETVILAKVDDNHMFAVSLYNLGLETNAHTSDASLQTVFPALEKLLCRHFESFPFERPDALTEEVADPDFVTQPFNESDVYAFFETHHGEVITEKETAVFTRLLQGMTAPATADDLCVSVHTVKTHRRNVYRRIGRARLLELINQFHGFLAQ